MTDRFLSLAVEMHKKFKFTDVIQKMDKQQLKDWLEFRVDSQIQEEVDEIGLALEDNDAHEVLDGFIDLLVFTLTAAIELVDDPEDVYKAYEKVMLANIAKEPGIKPERKEANKHGFPDLIKPEGWKAADISAESKFLSDRFNPED